MNEEAKRIGDQEQGLKGWWYRNKKTVLIVGGILAAAGASYAIYRNRHIVKGLFASIKQESFVINNPQVSVEVATPIVTPLTESPQAISKIINGGEAFDVSGHIRNLPNGWKATPEKIAEAAELGISLVGNQTLVDSYMKNAA